MVWVCLNLDYDFGGDRVEAYKKLWAPCNIDYDYINSKSKQLNYKEQTNDYKHSILENNRMNILQTEKGR